MQAKEATIKDIYTQIRKYLFYMIPEKWNSLYLYASVVEDKGREVGEMFFYYFPKGMIKKNPINVYEIPSKFNIEEKSYLRLAGELYRLIKELRHKCIILDRHYWSNITISIENVDFLVEYNSDDLKRSMYTSENRRKIWQHKYLEFPLDKFKRQDRIMIENYIKEEEQGMHGVTIYSETFYQEHAHNNIQYDMEVQEEKYVTDEDEGKVDLEKERNELRERLTSLEEKLQKNGKKPKKEKIKKEKPIKIKKKKTKYDNNNYYDELLDKNIDILRSKFRN